jgi:hypothetical protein
MPPGLFARQWRNWAALALGVLGLFQIIGDVTGVKALKGLGAATAASPFPKVFSDVNGLETFASDFKVFYRLPDGGGRSLAITPELYRKLAGPYNRRNVYGAALAYAPRLPQPLWEAVFCYGMKRGGPLRRELGIPDDAMDISVVITTKTRGRNDTWKLQPACAQ